MNSYMWGFWLGLFADVGWFVQHDLGPKGAGFLLTTLGVESPGTAKFWIFILMMIALMSVSAAAVQYFRFTGRTFVEDRIGFARSGGQDIGTISGLIAVVVTVFLFGTVVPSWIPGLIRVPLVLAMTFCLGATLASHVSRKAYATLFGTNVGMNR